MPPAVDIETAATVYQEAATREQVRASLGTMPNHIRQLFSADTAAKLTDEQLNAVTAAAKRGFRIDVFEVPALVALAANLDAETVKKTESFLTSDAGRRMVAADIAEAKLDEATIDKVMNGEIAYPTTPKREALFDKLERAARSTESTVQIFISMGQAVAIGTAVGAGRDPAEVAQSARKSGEAGRAALEQNMREPLRRYLAYGYRDLSDADLKHMLSLPRISARQALCRRQHRLDGRRVRRHGPPLRRAPGRKAARTRPGAVAMCRPAPPPAIAAPGRGSQPK